MRALFGLTALLVATGCSVGVDELDDAAREAGPGHSAAAAGANAAPSAPQGHVVITRREAVDARLTHVAARFVQWRGAYDAASASRVLGDAPRRPGGVDDNLAADVWRGAIDVPTDGCAWRGVRQPARPSASDLDREGSIELLDVGDIVLRSAVGAPAGSDEMVLAARAFPDVSGRVSGVVYTSRDANAALPSGDTWWLETRADDKLVRARVEVPEPPARVSIAGERLDRGVAVDGLEGRDIVPITWRASGDARDAITVVWRPHQRDELPPHDEGAVLACRFVDDGAATIDAELLAEALRDGDSDGITLDVHVHRSRRTTWVDDDGAETLIEFDFSVIGSAVVGSPTDSAASDAAPIETAPTETAPAEAASGGPAVVGMR